MLMRHLNGTPFQRELVKFTKNKKIYNKEKGSKKAEFIYETEPYLQMRDRWIVDAYRGRLLVGKQAHKTKEWIYK